MLRHRLTEEQRAMVADLLCRKPPMFGPGGADGCSHGWNSPEANGTRGTAVA